MKGNLRGHKKAALGEGARVHCVVCDKAFSLRENMIRLAKAVHGESKSHECQIYEKAFVRRGNVSKHMKSTHEN